MKPDIGRRNALFLLAAITAIGAAFRFYGLAWGAPYYHFHIDEHFVLGSADLLRRDPREAAMSPKFFMYTPFLPYLINIGRQVYETLSHPLNLTVPADEVTYMVIARGISAAFGTATILVVYAVASRISGRVAGLLAAFFLACAVLHLRDSHFAATDIFMTFFCVVALWFAIELAERGDRRSILGAGLAFGASILSKYTGAFVLGVIGLAYFLSPRRPKTAKPLSAWALWALRGLVPIVVGVALFFIVDPLVWKYFAKFQADLKEWVTDPLTGVTTPIWIGQFADVAHPQLYWLTNLLWWGLGPVLEIAGLLGLVWLVIRWDKRAAVAAAFPVIYFLAAGRTAAPMIRYSIPLIPAFAIAAGVAGGDWLARSRTRWIPQLVVAVATVATAFYALAYMNVYRQPDSRLQASQWLLENVPQDAKVLVEPSQNTPPMGSYLTAPDFNRDHVLWGGTTLNEARHERHDYYHLYTFDGYKYLYADRYSDEEKRSYIASRLATSDWIVIDDTYTQWYEHLPEAENGVVKQHYRDLLAGKLGFAMVKTFKVYPQLFGITINDDAAEMTFRLFDHPRVYVFHRYAFAQ